MVKKNGFLLIIFFQISFFQLVFPSSEFQNDAVFLKEIHTPQFYRWGWEMSLPLVNLGASDTLVLSFDDFSPEVKSYAYTIRHCDKDWNLTDEEFRLYVEGLEEVSIDDYSYSKNTHYPYIHFRALLDWQSMRPLWSGNYILWVYEKGKMENVVLAKRFYVLESKALINCKVQRPVNAMNMDEMQQLQVTIQHDIQNLFDPAGELFVYVSQNGRKDQLIRIDGPEVIRNNELVYQKADGICIPGGNEFRSFDLKSTRYQPVEWESFVFRATCYEAVLKPLENRYNKKYFTEQDLNGWFFIKNDYLSHDKSIDADYIKVRFVLPYDAPLPNRDVYVLGAFNDWNFTKEVTLSYRLESRSYELVYLLKQGYYNYLLVVRDRKTGKTDAAFLEGNHFETENDYLVFLYYRGFGMRHDQLFGYVKANSLFR